MTLSVILLIAYDLFIFSKLFIVSSLTLPTQTVPQLNQDLTVQILLPSGDCEFAELSVNIVCDPVL